jgi:hypothetical protein
MWFNVGMAGSAGLSTAAVPVAAVLGRRYRDMLRAIVSFLGFAVVSGQAPP